MEEDIELELEGRGRVVSTFDGTVSGFGAAGIETIGGSGVFLRIAGEEGAGEAHIDAAEPTILGFGLLIGPESR